jgi:hypothetical protein
MCYRLPMTKAPKVKVIVEPTSQSDRSSYFDRVRSVVGLGLIKIEIDAPGDAVVSGFSDIQPWAPSN